MHVNFAHLCDYALFDSSGKPSVIGIFNMLRIQMMSNIERLNQLLEYGWTITREDLDDGEIALRIAGLPNFVVAGTEAEVGEQFWDALKGYLQVAIKYNRPLQLEPSGISPVAVAAVPVPTSTTVNAGQYKPPSQWAQQEWGDLATA